ncbi:MAG: DUF1858 domain-containing protein [Bacillota bacterium]|nr:DUF1858 domain-containing protein [Bacillota bacterium]
MITKDMTIAEVLARSPQTAQVFLSYGMHCLDCPTARGESIEEAAEAHGINVDELLNQLNRLAIH